MFSERVTYATCTSPRGKAIQELIEDASQSMPFCIARADMFRLSSRFFAGLTSFTNLFMDLCEHCGGELEYMIIGMLR